MIRTRKKMKARTRRGGYTPLPLPLSSSSLSFYTFLWSSLSFYTFIWRSMLFYTFLCPLAVMAILTKSRVLFIFIHPKIGILIISTQIRVPTKYSQLKLKLTSQLPTLSLSSTCSMNVPLYVFAPSLCFCSSYCKVLTIQLHLLPLPCFNPFCDLSNVRSYFLFLIYFHVDFSFLIPIL